MKIETASLKKKRFLIPMFTFSTALLLVGYAALNFDCFIINVGGYPEFKDDALSKFIYDGTTLSNIVEIPPELVAGATLANEEFLELNEERIEFHNSLGFNSSRFNSGNSLFSKIVNDGCGNSYVLLIEDDQTTGKFLGSKRCFICM